MRPTQHAFLAHSVGLDNKRYFLFRRVSFLRIGHSAIGAAPAKMPDGAQKMMQLTRTFFHLCLVYLVRVGKLDTAAKFPKNYPHTEEEKN